jgi:hypothetical protein
LPRSKHLKSAKLYSMRREGATWQLRGYRTYAGAEEALLAFFKEQNAKEQLYLHLGSLVCLGGWLFA